MKAPLDRRQVLRGLLGGAAVTIGLPPLEAFFNGNGTAYAATGELPRRFGTFFWGNGNLPPRWTPAAVGAGWTPNETMLPLADLVEHLTVVSGMNVTVPNDSPHSSGPSGILSGGPLIVRLEGNTFPTATVDQVIARAIGGETRFASLEVGAQPVGRALSLNGPDNPNPSVTSPFRLFERVFGGGFTAPGEARVVDPRLALRRSVLDAVLDQGSALKQRLGAADRVRLDQHFEGVRALEKRLAGLAADPPDLEACARPEEPPMEVGDDAEGRFPLLRVNTMICDILAMALACDQTRVFTHVFTDPVNNLLFPGASAGHHQLTHDEPGDQPQVAAILVQIMEAFGYLVRALQAVPEGDGTLLDNCAILATSDVSFGRDHSLQDYPILIAGSAGGALKSGIHYASPSGESASKVIFSLMRAVGVRTHAWGLQTARVTAGLPAIEAS